MSATYFIPASWTRMQRFGAAHALERTYKVIEKIEVKLDNRLGLKITTETPVSESDQQTYGLVPVEENELINTP
ncbi:hypothetical protein KW796_03330 [Candidatus Parcubacteria bacterium]|nr:hypothetical protein [Candidatus Parcubacteria bacterium]